MYFWRSELVTILDYAVKAFPVGPTHTVCKYLAPRSISNKRTWGYGMYPFNEKLIIGGTQKTPSSGNSQLMLYDGKSLDYLDLAAPGLPGPPSVTEYYSYLREGSRLLIGTYPAGRIAELTDTFKLTSNPPVTQHSQGGLESEAQSMTMAAGSLLVGVYPFGELFERTPDGTWHSREIVSGLRSTGNKIPFDKGYRSRFGITDNEFYAKDPTNMNKKTLAAFPKELLGFPNKTHAKRTRLNGIARSSWGFRITSLAVFDGQLCLGTGNMQGVKYDRKIHDWIPYELGLKYGQIYCAKIPNHVLIHDLVPGRYSISVKNRNLTVSRAGLVIARRELKQATRTQDN